MYRGFHTQDGGIDMDLEKIVFLAREVGNQGQRIESGLAAQYDRTCRYFDNELPAIKNACIGLIKLIEANGY